MLFCSITARLVSLGYDEVECVPSFLPPPLTPLCLGHGWDLVLQS